MNSNKIHSDKANKLDIWKRSEIVGGLDYSSTDDISLHYKVKLPPPPCPPEKFRSSFHEYSRRSFRKSDDPFLMAYKECTKSSKKDKWGTTFGRRNNDDHVGFGFKKPMSIFSCKKSCGVIDDSIIKESKLPILRSRRDRFGD